MQCGTDPNESFGSSCRFMCHKLFPHLFWRASTTLLVVVQASQVSLELNHMHHWNLTELNLHLLPPFSPVTIVRVLDLSFCNISWANAPLLLDLYNDIPRFVLGATLLVLAVAQTLKQSVDMYKATKQWQPNQYMKLLVRDGIIYFIVYVMLSPSLP